MIARHIKTLAVVPAILATALLLSAGTAGAKTYDVWSCSQDSSVFAKLGTTWFSYLGFAENFCPVDGLRIMNADALHQSGSAFYWEWTAGSESEVVQVTFTVSGGDEGSGLAYELAATSNTDDPPIATFAPAPGGTRTDTVSFPVGTTTVAFRGVCRAAECSGPNPLLIREVKIRLKDDSPPGIGLSATPALNTDADGGTTGDLAWHQSKSMKVSAGASDFASGVKGAAFLIDDEIGPLWSASTKCEYPTENMEMEPPVLAYDWALICDPTANAPDLLDLNGLSEGRHRIRFVAEDAVGNVSPEVSGWFGIDDTPPAAPETVEARGEEVNDHGWTRTNVVQAVVGDAPATGSDVAPIAYPLASIIRDDIPNAPSKPIDPYGYQNTFASEGHFRIDGWFVDEAGNRGYSKPAFIGFDRTQPPTPALDANPWVTRDDLIEGYRQTWPAITAPADVESGICGFDMKYDQESVRVLNGPATISGNVTEATVPANLPEGYNYVHAASVSCADNVSLTDDEQLNVDATDPSVALEGLTPDLWQKGPLSLALSPSDSLSGVEDFHWTVDGGDPRDGGPAGAALELGDGEHAVTTWASDVAGNVSDPQTTVINVDGEAPVSWVTGPGQNDLTAFTAHTEDTVSGLDSAALQLRRVDQSASESERVWRQVGGAHLPTGSARSHQTFSRTIDDDALSDGTYELRVAAVDLAGNTGYGSTLPVGGAFTISVPLRPRPAIAVNIADLIRECSSATRRGCRSRTQCRKNARCSFTWVVTQKNAGVDRIVDWGDREALSGAVLAKDGSPIAGMPLRIYATPNGGSRELVATTTSSSAGKFEWRIPAGPTRLFEVVSAAGGGYSAASAAASIAVRAGVEFQVADRTVKSGQRVTLSGRIASGSLGVPAAGKRVEIQAWNDADEEWAPFRSRMTDGSGRFRAIWTVKPTASAGILRLRAAVLSGDGDWPFEAGKSRSIRVHVRP